MYVDDSVLKAVFRSLLRAEQKWQQASDVAVSIDYFVVLNYYKLIVFAVIWQLMQSLD